MSDLDRGLFFSLFRFPVRVHPSFWVVAVLLGLGGARGVGDLAVWVAIVFVSLLVHELGHAQAAFRWAVVERISIHGLGGETRWQALMDLAWHQRLRIAVAGPLAGFSLALLVYIVDRVMGRGWLDQGLGHSLFLVNMAWGIFNLLPIVPLDGGRAAAEVLVRLMGPRGEAYAAMLGVLASGAAFVAAIAAGHGPLAALMVAFGGWNFGILKRHYDANRKTDWNPGPRPDQERERY